jgi:hypothetical protein
MSKHQYMEYIPGPSVLDPDDVITMRLRARPGIDWSAKWALTELKAFYDAINTRPVKSIRVSAIYLYANRLKSQTFDITDLAVVNQGEYANALKAITADFAVQPNPPHRAITD